MPRAQLNRALSHRFGHAGKLVHGFPFNGQRGECGCDLRVSNIGINQRAEKKPGFNPAQVLAAHQAQRDFLKVVYLHGWNQRRRGDDRPIFTAIARAFDIARALFTVSSNSKRGSESATIPAPA